ncbi:hypothetical protein [Lichenifustis flavocetrariae]|uniref:General secretion pathway protein GspM n=1 Tax=Lichenifustis flavocetrariae TaxID=2949735 RepID=A0AA41YWQ9_9HYPH|nr:hypothetical protein [Lichenifustis flavocetrariae]MCW6508715.1 hypothetical protein [Lichenifustis flavocetrariae]
MPASPLMQRAAAVGLLAGLVLVTGTIAWTSIDSYADGQGEITEKRLELQSLRDLAEARTTFARLLPKSGKGALILPSTGNAQEALAAAVAHAADGQQVLIDGVTPLPQDTALATASVQLRGTQSGVYAFLKSVEQQVPYLVVPRLEITPFRAADPDHNKPLIVSAEIRVAALVAPAPPARPGTTAPPAEPVP